MSMNSFFRARSFGVTLIELVISVAIISVIAMVLYPIATEGVRALHRVEDASTFNREANGAWLYLRPLLAGDGAVTVLGANGMTFISSGNTYVLAPVVAGNGYDLMISKNGGASRVFLKSIARLTGPSRPGLELAYLDYEGNVTATPNQVRSIDIAVSFQGKSTIYRFQSTLLVDSGTVVVESF